MNQKAITYFIAVSMLAYSLPIPLLIAGLCAQVFIFLVRYKEWMP